MPCLAILNGTVILLGCTDMSPVTGCAHINRLSDDRKCSYELTIFLFKAS